MNGGCCRRSVRRAAATAVASALLVAGCVGSVFQPDAPRLQRYALSPLSAREAPPQTLPVHVTVEVGSVSPGLATERVALIRNRREFDYFSGTQWPDALGFVVEDLLLKSLQNDGRFGSVSLESTYARAGYAISVDVLDFQAEYPPGAELPETHVRLAVEVADVSGRLVLASFVVEARAAAERNAMTDLMAAFEQAFHAVSMQLADRAVDAISERMSEQEGAVRKPS